MAKKIISFLCALAVLVSMTAIGLSAVFAEDNTPSEIVFDATTVAGTPANASRFYQGVPSVEGGLEGYAIIADKCYYTVEVGDTYNIGDKFDISWSQMVIKPQNNSYTLKVGDLEVLVQMSLTNVATNFLTVSATYGEDTVIAATPISNDKAVKKTSDATPASDPYIKDINLLTNNFLTGTSYMFRTTDVAVSYNDGALDVTFSNGDGESQTVSGTIADADFSASEITVKHDTTYSMDSVFTFHNFEGSYYTPGQTIPDGEGGEGGEGGDDVQLSDVDFPALKDGTVTAVTAPENSAYGVWESTAKGGTVIYLSNAEADVAFADTLDIKGDFEFSFIMDRAYGNTDGVTVKLGKLEIAAVTAGAPQQKVVIKYDGTELAASTATAWGQWTQTQEDNNAEDDLLDSAFLDEIHTNVNAGLYAHATNSYKFYAVKVTVTYDSETGVVKACIGKTDADLTGTTGFRSVEATLTDADFSNVAMTINVKDTIQYYHTALYDFEGTFKGVAPEGGITPPPAGEGGEGGEGGEDVEAIVVTFDATKGTLATTTATVGADGKLASLPTPTYSGLGVYVFEGWFTSAVDGEKITADTVFTENTTVYAQWKRTITTTKMDTFKEVTEDDITRPEEGTPWNCGGSGPFYTEGLGHGLGCGGYTSDDNFITANVGTYNIGTYFKNSFDLWYKNKSVSNGAFAGTQNWVISYGDLAITITRSPRDITNQEGQNLYVKSITYKGQEVTLEGDQHFAKTCAATYAWNDQFVIDNAAEHYTYVSSDEFMYPNVASYWGSNNHYPNTNMGFVVEYDMGVLTISNTTGTTVNVLTADLTKVAGFDVATAFNNSKVSVDMSTRKEANTTISLITNFAGEFEVATAGSGSGSGSGSGTGNGSGSGNAPQTGDNRNIVLPICVAMASVAVAGATLIRRKRA